MSDHDKKQPNNDDLLDVKSLLKDVDASDGGFSLDDILAEYGKGRRPRSAGQPWPEHGVPVEDNVVAFPGGTAVAEREAPPAAEEPEGPSPNGADRRSGPIPDAPEDDPVLPFPGDEGGLASLLRDIGRKADEYADRMFEESEKIDPKEVRRLEELIPGTDREDDEPPPPRHVRQEPPPPDLPPQELAKRYGKGLKPMRVRVILLFLLCLPALIQLLVPAAGWIWYPPLDAYSVQLFLSAGLLGAGMLLGGDVLLSGLGRALRGRFGMDTLLALAAVFTLCDALTLAVSQNREGQLPYCAVVLVGLLFQLHGHYHKRCALRLSCRTAAASSEPYRVTLDAGKWNGKDTYTKWSGAPEGFGSQIQADDGAQRIYRRVCPILAMACVLFSLLSSVGMGKPERLLWCLSATFTASAAFGGALAYGRPFHTVARRLSPGGAALAGWPGAAQSKRGNRVVVGDLDLFPPGFVQLNGIKVLGGFPLERVVSYTATLIRDSGSGLTRPFHDLLRTHGGLFRKADSLYCHEGGGLSANIRGEQVLVGSAAFMTLMEVPLPAGLNVKNAVFCAIDGTLAGIFALNYSLPDTCFPALELLIREKIGPVLATRDFNLIPAMLQQRFKLATDRMDFPPVERRRELSDPNQSHSDTLTALLCREGLLPFAEALAAARRLRVSARMGAVVCCMASVIGLLLAYYLTSVGAYSSLSALNLLLYMLLWLAPVWFLTDGANRF